MTVETYDIKLSTGGDDDTVDITDQVQGFVDQSGIRDGIVTVFIPGSTGGITTIEYEPGVVTDLKELLDRIIPGGRRYKHDRAWGDGNAHSHMRSALIGPSITVPVADGSLTLGTWQQIVFIDFDNRSRSRKLVVNIIGE